MHTLPRPTLNHEFGTYPPAQNINIVGFNPLSAKLGYTNKFGNVETTSFATLQDLLCDNTLDGGGFKTAYCFEFAHVL
jgi:hypothetical protein